MVLVMVTEPGMIPLSLSPWIERFAATAVEGGFVTALALVCLVQYLWHLTVVTRFRRDTTTLQQQLADLATEIAKAQHVQAQCERENHLLRDFLAEASIDVALGKLLRQFIPPGGSGFAAFLLSGPPWTIRQSVGISNVGSGELPVDAAILQRLEQAQTVILTGRELAEAALFQALPPSDRLGVERLFVIRTSPPGELLDGLLVTTTLPVHPGPPAEQQMFAERVLAAVGHHIRRTASHTAQAQELRVTREILELRAVVDAEFRSPQEMAEQFLERLAAVAGFHQASVHLLRPWDAKLSCLARYQSSQIGRAADAWAAADDDLTQVSSGVTHLNHFSGESLTAVVPSPPFAEAVTVPMHCQGRTLGVLSLARQTVQSLGASEIELISWAADFLFDTILKTADRALTEDRARRDALTGLANRHTFDASLEEDLRRTIRTGRECSLILFDLDHFKAVNDRYGHLAGDEALRTVAHLLREKLLRNLRGTDRPLAARYGGEELVVILPGVGLSGALRLAEDFRQQVEQTEIVSEGQAFRLTLSGGVAVAPLHSRSARGLIAAADEALYEAKQSGRNQIVAANQRRHSRTRSSALAETAGAG